jgi:ATP-dependent Clp protease ATP-binding subunit ClpA
MVPAVAGLPGLLRSNEGAGGELVWPSVFERFTDRARRVVVLAQEEARMLNHNYIGTEHILLGLIHEGEGVAANALKAVGVTRHVVRAQVEEIIGKGQSEATGHIPFTPRAKKVLELSLREALQLRHNYIGTEHILLGVLREGEGVAAQVLQNLGADLNSVRLAVVDLLAGFSEDPPAEHRPGTEEASEAWPLCPRCRTSLEESASYRVLDLRPPGGEGEARAVPFAFCGKCGTWLGTIS